MYYRRGVSWRIGLLLPAPAATADCPRGHHSSSLSNHKTMAIPLDDLRVEDDDEEMVRVLRAKTGAGRLKILSNLFASAPGGQRRRPCLV